MALSKDRTNSAIVAASALDVGQFPQQVEKTLSGQIPYLNIEQRYLPGQIELIDSIISYSSQQAQVDKAQKYKSKLIPKT